MPKLDLITKYGCVLIKAQYLSIRAARFSCSVNLRLTNPNLQIGTMASSGKRTSKGRQKIEIKMVEAKNKRQVTFSKRKLGLFNKAAELSILTGAQMSLMVFSKNGKLFSFGNPSVDAVIVRYLCQRQSISVHGHDQSLSAVTSHARNCERQYFVAMNNLKKEEISKCVEKKEDAAAGRSASRNGGGFWWERRNVRNMDLEEINHFRASLQKLKEMVREKVNQMIKKTPVFSFSSLLFDDQANLDYY